MLYNTSQLNYITIILCYLQEHSIHASLIFCANMSSDKNIRSLPVLTRFYIKKDLKKTKTFYLHSFSAYACCKPYARTFTQLRSNTGCNMSADQVHIV